MENNTLSALIAICCTFVVCSFIGGILYYNLEKPSSYELMERLADKGYSPAVLKCSFIADWNQPLVYTICERILVDNNITREEAEALIRGLE